jgi:TatD DNase family protein
LQGWSDVLVDTHCHLDAKEFDDDREAVIQRAIQAGVTTMISIGTGLESCRAAIALAERYPQVWVAVGIDPFDAGDVNDETLSELRELAQHPRVVAIGEIGLDYHWDTHPRDVQRRAFEAQLQLAADLGKPVIIHNREAHQDTLAILREWVRNTQYAVRNTSSPEQRTQNPGAPGVMHCFSGSPDLALSLVELGFMISLAGPLTFKNARKPPEVARTVPLDHLVVETDAPWLSPHPYRGKRNEPARVRLVAQRLAEIKGLSFEEIAAATTTNAQCLFRLPEK